MWRERAAREGFAAGGFLLLAAWVGLGGPACAEAGPILTASFPGTVRAYTSAALDSRDQKVWFYGGTGPGVGRLGDLWSYDLRSDRWEQVTWEGEGPTRLLGHGMVYDPVLHRLLLYGGSQTPSFIGDWFCSDKLWQFDLEARRWSIIPLVEPPLGIPMYDRLALARDPRSGDLWSFFGTCEDLAPSRSFAHLVLREGRWTGRVTTSAEPRGRMNHSAVYDSRRERIVLFGGDTQSELFLDLAEEMRKLTIVWAFDPDTDTWTALTDGRDRPVWMKGVGVYDSNSDLLLAYSGIVGQLFTPFFPYYSDEVWTFDLANNSWSVLSPQGSLTYRQHATAAYCPCRSQMLVIGGRTTSGFTYPSPDSMAFFVPIERPAEFSWKGRPFGDRRPRRHRLGLLQFPEGSEEVTGFEEGSVRLVNCETEKTLARAERVRCLGRKGWVVRFKDLAPEVAEAEAKGRLVLTGRPLGAQVNFLAPLPAADEEEISFQGRERTRPTSEKDVLEDETPEEENLSVRATRAPGGWRIECAGLRTAEADLLLYDVAGRLRFRRDSAFRVVEGEAASFVWDGRGDGGVPLPKGIYFARVAAAGESAKGKILIW
jgi:hypothetical protein